MTAQTEQKVDKLDRTQGQGPALQISQDGPIRRLRLNRPDARNSLSLEMLDSLYEALSDCREDPATKVVILSANEPGFCAGHDLKEMTAERSKPDRGRAFFTTTMQKCSAVMQAIISCPKPVIASVQGIATAAGCQLVASCDLAVASTDARFSTPGVHIGLFCSTPMVALSRNISRKKAMEMLLTGEMLSAQQALDWGLINRVCAPEALAATTTGFAQSIADKPASTVKIGKEAFYKQLEMPLAEAYDYAAAVMVENMLNWDAEEGIGAFIDKRPPNWSS
jgi:enoyl-CoA hydratase/carnithine racemase